MRYIDINRVKPGMMIANDVLDSYNRILVAKNTLLTDSYINHLKNRGIMALYIDDEYSKGIDIEPSISPILRSKALSAVRNKDIDACRNVAKMIVEEMLANGFHEINLQDLRTFDDYTFAHSVNVAVLSCTMGLGINLNEKQLEDLVFAALLHDLGKMALPNEVLNKPGQLTREEYALIKTHPQISYEMLEGRLDISSYVKNAVLCHHENHDGSGYPNGLSEYNIALLARLLHVCDVYDALTSARPYKPAYSPYAALEIIEGERGTAFDPVMIDAFIRCVPVYPKGTELILSDGTRGLVVENSEEHNLRPIIRREDGSQIDLASSRYADLTVTSPSETEYLELIEAEKKREEMKTPIPRYHIMILDKQGDTYRSLEAKLNYLYDFQWVQSESSAEGYIRKDGYPDLIVVDVDNYDLSDPERMKDLNCHLSAIVPIIIVGSYRDVKTIQLLRSIGIQNYVLKPLRIIYMQSEIRNKIQMAKSDGEGLNY